MSFWNGHRWEADTPPAADVKREGRAKHVAKALLEAGLITALAFGLIAGSTFAARGGGGGGGRHGGGGGGTCVSNTPAVTVQNNWTWGSSGSWGTPGQQLAYLVQVTNNDSGCSSSSFVVSLSAPDGFSVSMPTTTISLGSMTAGSLWAYVTAPAAAADGNYSLVASAQRAGSNLSVSAVSSTSYYKVYSVDTTAPTLFWSNPWDGATITDRTYNVTVSSSDDHAVKAVDLYIDGAYATTKSCDDLTYICQLNFSWSTQSGSHTVTFVSTDWMGNQGTLTVSFSVSTGGNGGGTSAKLTTTGATTGATTVTTTDATTDTHGNGKQKGGGSGGNDSHTGKGGNPR